ncbi:MAG: CPBP family intramembrane metalloprotease [Gammaproteobacteria bacterium]|nr:CPBP family intramembrane metalloprotease [Gammaproteobacteria bacterium]
MSTDPLSLLEPLSLPTLLTFVALFASVIALWLPLRFAWGTLLTIAVIIGYSAGVLTGPALFPMGAMAIVCWLYRQQNETSKPLFPGVKLVLAIAVVVLALLLGLHVFPGFNNPVYVRDLVLSPGAASYTRKLTFDTWIAGILVLGLCYDGLIHTRREWIEAFKRAWPVIVINTVVIVPLALAMGFVHFDPKWTTYYFVWAVIYLFFVILGEEALFRGFIQRELAQALSKRPFGQGIAIGITAVLFGLVHFDGGIGYIVLATIAGIGYGITFQRSGRIEMSILAHFTLNSMRFLLFTYPYLA